jgi:hypothetical protein
MIFDWNASATGRESDDGERERGDVGSKADLLIS